MVWHLSYGDLTFCEGADDFVVSFPPSRGTCAEGDERTNKIVSAITESQIAAANARFFLESK